MSAADDALSAMPWDAVESWLQSAEKPEGGEAPNDPIVIDTPPAEEADSDLETSDAAFDSDDAPSSSDEEELEEEEGGAATESEMTHEELWALVRRLEGETLGPVDSARAAQAVVDSTSVAAVLRRIASAPGGPGARIVAMLVPANPSAAEKAAAAAEEAAMQEALEVVTAAWARSVSGDTVTARHRDAVEALETVRASTPAARQMQTQLQRAAETLWRPLLTPEMNEALYPHAEDVA